MTKSKHKQRNNSKTTTSKNKKKSIDKMKQTPSIAKSQETIRKSIRSCSAEANIKSHQHYRLNLEKLPFCVGQSTTPSHNLTTNIQSVMSLLKQHHPKLCGTINEKQNQILTNTSCTNKLCLNAPRRSIRSIETKNEISKQKRSTSTPNTKVTKNKEMSEKQDICDKKNSLFRVPSNSNLSKTFKKQSIRKIVAQSSDEEDSLLSHDFDWNECLRILQEEYTKLVLHHYDLTKKIMKSLDSKKRNEYELKAEILNKKMKSKARQINKLKTLQHSKSAPKKVEIQDENKFIGPENDKVCEYEKKASHSNRIATQSSNSLNKLTKPAFNSSSTSLFYDSITTSTSGFNTLQLFKDIKNLQYKIQNDLDY